MPSDVLTIFVVYHDPADYPGQYVVRRQCIHPGGHIVVDSEPTIVTDTLERARAVVPPNLWRLDALPADDPVIVETWM